MNPKLGGKNREGGGKETARLTVPNVPKQKPCNEPSAEKKKKGEKRKAYHTIKLHRGKLLHRQGERECGGQSKRSLSSFSVKKERARGRKKEGKPD